MSRHRPPAFALHHVQLAMPHGGEAAARAFYAGVLGLAEVVKPPALAARGGVWFRAGALELHLGVEEDFRPARKAHPGILVEDLDGLAGHLHAHGLRLRPDTNFPGFRRFYLDDCFGNRLEFLSPLNDAQPQADPVTSTI
jgi:catechol 2,3-dioxygenase-like lactoylglutathione lyase family enzyme